LLDSCGRIKLTDFGISKRLENLSGDPFEVPGHIRACPYWISPEVYLE